MLLSVVKYNNNLRHSDIAGFLLFYPLATLLARTNCLYSLVT